MKKGDLTLTADCILQLFGKPEDEEVSVEEEAGAMLIGEFMLAILNFLKK